MLEYPWKAFAIWFNPHFKCIYFSVFFFFSSRISSMQSEMLEFVLTFVHFNSHRKSEWKKREMKPNLSSTLNAFSFAPKTTLNRLWLLCLENLFCIVGAPTHENMRKLCYETLIMILPSLLHLECISMFLKNVCRKLKSIFTFENPS